MRHALGILALGLAGGRAGAEPPRTLAMPDLSRTRVAGVDFTVGGFNQDYSALTTARFDLFVDMTVTDAAKVSLRLPVGYERTIVDEGDDIIGPWMGNLAASGRWLPLTGDLQLGLGGTLILPIGSASEPDDPGVTTALYHRTHAPRLIDPTFWTVALEGDLRYRRGDAFGQLSTGVLTVFDGGPEIDTIRLGLGGGVAVARHFAVVGELSAVVLPPDGDVDYGLDAGVEWRPGAAAFTARYYLPLHRTIDGSYGALGVLASMAF